ncbi:phage tail tape measure protein [Luteolibacter sp. GHJ8]|uniref:Phage tail tape measure protein n=1 Tax=Luteolibacter rhizosphaerae TaxID=2989719 RepID=A0ABT3G8N7_9BACT|nr:phage tail tape measure protein [Luteolibacter rhizosphaerae]MCW1915992.1 phage tail tape measure protein [Luteolibacter rhizosphaerae]
MALLGTLQVRMRLDTAAFGQKFNSFTKDLEKRAKGFSRGLSGLTDFGSLVGSAGIGAALTQGISAAGNFESTINQVAAAADLGKSAITGLTESALAMSKGTVFSANQTAEAMLALAKAGMSPADQAAGGLVATMQLAASEGLDLAFSAERIAEAMGAFKLQAADASSIADALAGASVASTASVEGLAQALQQVGTVAKQKGVSLQDTSAALALFAQNGLKGSDAGTSLKTMLSRLIPETDKAADAMEKYGLKFINSEGAFLSLSEVSEQLRQKLGGLSAAQQSSALQTIFGSDAIRAAAILTQEGAGGLQAYIDATKDKNAAEKLSEARTQGFNGAMLRLRNTFEQIAIGISRGGFLEALTKIATKGAEFVTRLSTLPDWVKNIGIGFAVAGALIPPFALAISQLVLAGPALLTGLGAVTGFLLGPWGLAIMGAIGAGILFKDELISACEGLKSWFAGWLDENQLLLAEFGVAWEGLVTALQPLWEAIKTGFSLIGQAILSAFGANGANVMQAFGSQAGSVLQGLVMLGTRVVQELTTVVNWIATYVPLAAGKLHELYTTISKWLSDTRAMWVDIWNGLVQDLENAWIEIKTTLRASADAIMEFWRNYDWLELGQAIIDGIVHGLKAGASTVIQAAKDLGQSVIDGAKGILRSNSPSKVFIGIGEDVGNGFVIGIRKKISEAGKAVQQLVSTNPGSFGASFMASATRNIVGPDADKQFKAWTESISKGAIQVQSAWSSAMTHVGSAIDEFVKTGKLNFSDLVRSIIADLASTALKSAFNGLLQGILGATGGMFGGSTGSTGGGILSGLGSIFGGIFGGMASFEGGGYTGTGSRSGGLDGRGGRLALLHPKETVIDHAAIKRDARGSQRPQVHAPISIVLQPGVSHEELARIMPTVQQGIIKTLLETIPRGGRFASAFGQ